MDDRHRKEAGTTGEQAALRYLTDRKLKLIAQNYRCRSGELDLVMLDGGTLALIEVRYRADGHFGGAAGSVTWRKQQRLISAARHLMLSRADLRRYPARFDVIAISPGKPGLQIEWIRSAFTL
ncbi:MAG TPA: YraN family protein [Povalibacter sp.]|jgi:putative endonuclease|nr:YraN family protein [Povalibacter sp.]